MLGQHLARNSELVNLHNHLPSYQSLARCWGTPMSLKQEKPGLAGTVAAAVSECGTQFHTLLPLVL